MHCEQRVAIGPGSNARLFLPIILLMRGYFPALLFSAGLATVCPRSVLPHDATDAGQPEFADYRQSGEVIRAYSVKADAGHYGVTLRLYEGNVRTLAAGTVYSAGPLRGFGNVIIVDHGHGWHTLYADIAHTRVAVGQKVGRGALIGAVRAKRLFLVVSYKGNPINPSDVIGRRPRSPGTHAERVQSFSGTPAPVAVAINAGN